MLSDHLKAAGGEVLRGVRTVTVIGLAISLLMAGCLGDEDVAMTFNGNELASMPVAQEFVLVDSTNTSFDSRDIDADLTIFTFVFTRCRDVCLAQTESMKWLLDNLDENDSARVQILSISLDPWHDSVSTMADFASSKDADWPHLTSPDAGNMSKQRYFDLESVWGAYGVSLETAPAEDGEDDFVIVHNQPIVLVDNQHRKRVSWDNAEFVPELFLEDVQTLLDDAGAE